MKEVIFVVFFVIALLIITWLSWKLDSWYNKTDFAKNLRFYGFKTFKYYYHKIIVVPWQLRYKGNKEKEAVFDPKLESNFAAMLVMNREERTRYSLAITLLREMIYQKEIDFDKKDPLTTLNDRAKRRRVKNA